MTDLPHSSDGLSGQPEELASWVKPTNAYFRERLKVETHGRTEAVIKGLQAATHERLRHELQIVMYKDGERYDHLPVNPALYEGAQFRIATEPLGTEGKVLDAGYYGYNIREGDFRRIGSLNFMRQTDANQIAEVGFGSEESMRHFRNHLYGRTLRDDEKTKIHEIQNKLIAHLREDPQSRERLSAFAEKRGWPEGMEDRARLAYFHEKLTPLREWAKENGYTAEEMRLAGWFDESFTNAGKHGYSVRDSHVIRIPYFDNGEIGIWRTRNLKLSKSESHKYTGWPLDRSIERHIGVNERLYNSWELHRAKGKPVILTEGEFKCNVCTEFTGILTVGIPGITEVDDEMLRALVDAKASDYFVILDRDPQGKGLMRVDGITDSQRAAYSIACRLKAMSAPNVRVGRIPDVRQGSKVGIDDLILDTGAESVYEILRKAKSPFQYARDIGLNTTFQEVVETRQRVRKALHQYDVSASRGGKTVDENLYKEATHLRSVTENIYRTFLQTRFHGARRLNQPLSSLFTYRKTMRIPNMERKLVVAENGEGISLERFLDDIIFFDYFPKNTPQMMKWVLRKDLRFPLSSKQIAHMADTGEISGSTQKRFAKRGAEALGGQSEEPYPLPDRPGRMASLLLAGYLAQHFPADEYEFRQNLSLCVRHDAYWEDLVKIPVSIFRRSTGDAVAFAGLAMWEKNDNRNNGLQSLGHIRNASLSFLRGNASANSHIADKRRMVVDTLWPYWYERNVKKTAERMSSFGISEDVIRERQLLMVESGDIPELKEHFKNRRLLNQATYAGLFQWDEDENIIPRFTGTSVLLPIKDSDGRVVSLRVLPFLMEDHLPPALPPDPKIVRNLNGRGRNVSHLVRKPHAGGFRASRLSAEAVCQQTAETRVANSG